MSTTFPGQFVSSPIGYSYGPDAVMPPFYLGGVQLTAAGATQTLTFPAFNTLEVRGFITGFSASDLAALQFNGDTGNNYWDRNIDIVAGGVIVVDNATTTTSQIRIGVAGTKGLFFRAFVGNFATIAKTVNTSVSVLGTDAVGTAGTAVIASGGQWINTTAQITSVTIKVVGANNFLAGSSFSVFGGV